MTALRKLRRGELQVVRRQLRHLLAWALWHSSAPHRGRPMTLLTLELAASDLRRYLCDLAERGVFRFFGIANGFALGDVPAQIMHLGRGSIAIENLPDVLHYIMAGGARGRGWVAPSELTIDDLAR